MDSLLLAFNPKNRKDILSNVIVSSLTSLNPVSALKDHINFFRTLIGIEKTSTIIANSQNISKDEYKITLKACISSVPYYKNKFKKNMKHP